MGHLVEKGIMLRLLTMDGRNVKIWQAIILSINNFTNWFARSGWVTQSRWSKEFMKNIWTVTWLKWHIAYYFQPIAQCCCSFFCPWEYDGPNRSQDWSLIVRPRRTRGPRVIHLTFAEYTRFTGYIIPAWFHSRVFSSCSIGSIIFSRLSHCKVLCWR